MKINRLFFLVIGPFTKRDYDRFGISILKNYGFDVQIYDLYSLFLDNEVSKEVFEEVISIDNYEKLEKLISRKIDNTIYLKMYGNSSQLLEVDLILTKYNVLTLLFNVNILPVALSTQSILYKIRFLLISFNLKKIIKFIKFNLLKNRLKKDDFALIGGAKGIDNSRIDKKTKLIYGHTLDYDIFLEQKNIESLVDYEYAIFLDEYLPYHPDEKLFGSDKYLNKIADIYYEKLNVFFDYLELTYKLKIVIAAHPTSEYEKIGNPFNNRKIIKGKTNQLVLNSKFCISHFSTAINFAVMHKKKIFFITSRDIDYIYSDFIENFAAEFNQKRMFIDNIDKKSVIDLNIDEKLYQQYMVKYIKDTKINNKNINNWEIIAQYFINRKE